MSKHRRIATVVATTLTLALAGACDPGGTEGSATGGSATGDADPTGDAEGEPCMADVFLDVAAAPGAGDGYDAPELTVTCTDDAMIVQSNGIPHYTFVPVTPNPLRAADHRWEVPRSPEIAAAPTDLPLLGLIGFSVNGLPIFGPNEAAQPADSAWGDPIYNSIMDECLGHTADEYHYHALVERCLRAAGLVAEPWALPEPDAGEPSPILGFAYDGFPIYGARECVDAGCSAVRTMESSWVQIGDPKTDAWDNYAYQEQAGEHFLDRCNGHVGPGGDYHYHATATFPYVLGCFTGTPADGVGGFGAGGGDTGGDTGGGEAPPMCAAGQTSMCCGDGACDGPETAANCAADC